MAYPRKSKWYFWNSASSSNRISISSVLSTAPSD
jgi:hypothetical protein